MKRKELKIALLEVDEKKEIAKVACTAGQRVERGKIQWIGWVVGPMGWV